MLGKYRYRIHWLHILSLLLLVSLGASTLYARVMPLKEGASLPGEGCQTEPAMNWTTQEKWAWNEICRGKTADFNLNKGYGGFLDPKKDINWPETRTLRPIFLETILLHRPYKEALTRNGVQIVGAWFKESLDLSSSSLTHELTLRSCRFDSYVRLDNIRTSGVIGLRDSKFNGGLTAYNLQSDDSLYITGNMFTTAILHMAKITGMVFIEGSSFSGQLYMNGIRVGDSLHMYGKNKFEEVNLGGAEIGGQLAMAGSSFLGKLDMNSIQVEQNLFMTDKVNFKEVDLRGAKIGGHITMDTSTFSGKLDMDGVQVGRDLRMSNKGNFVEVNLRGAKINGDVNMGGSSFSGKLNMNIIQVGQNLFMKDKAKFIEIDLQGAKIGGYTNMNGSTFSGKLDMGGVQVERSLQMSDKATFAQVILRAAKIGGDVDINGSTFSGKLNMNDTQVGDSLLMYGRAKFAEVDLNNAKIEGQVAMIGSKFSGKMNMDSIRVERNLVMQDNSDFAEIYLRYARIRGQMSMDRSFFSGEVNMRGMDVGGKILMRDGAIFKKPLRLDFAKIDDSVYLSGSTFASVDLSGTHIRGDLVLGPPTVHWMEEAKLTLSGTETRGLQYSPDAWPKALELEGFVYGYLGDLSGDDKSEMNMRDTRWFEKWLAKQKRYTPQPYEQLANTLEKEGYKAEAREILYAGKNRELDETKGFFDRRWLLLLKYLIGYKYRIWLSAIWGAVLVLIGAIVVRLTKQGPANGIGKWGILYSFDMLLPIVKLREEHYERDFIGGARYYFYFHKIMGYVLVSFLIVGLAGLTK